MWFFQLMYCSMAIQRSQQLNNFRIWFLFCYSICLLLQNRPPFQICPLYFLYIMSLRVFSRGLIKGKWPLENTGNAKAVREPIHAFSSLFSSICDTLHYFDEHVHFPRFRFNNFSLYHVHTVIGTDAIILSADCWIFAHCGVDSLSWVQSDIDLLDFSEIMHLC